MRCHPHHHHHFIIHQSELVTRSHLIFPRPPPPPPPSSLRETSTFNILFISILAENSEVCWDGGLHSISLTAKNMILEQVFQAPELKWSKLSVSQYLSVFLLKVRIYLFKKAMLHNLLKGNAVYSKHYPRRSKLPNYLGLYGCRWMHIWQQDAEIALIRCNFCQTKVATHSV